MVKPSCCLVRCQQMGQPILVGCTHLFWDPRYPDVKVSGVARVGLCSTHSLLSVACLQCLFVCHGSRSGQRRRCLVQQRYMVHWQLPCSSLITAASCHVHPLSVSAGSVPIVHSLSNGSSKQVAMATASKLQWPHGKEN